MFECECDEECFDDSSGMTKYEWAVLPILIVLITVNLGISLGRSSLLSYETFSTPEVGIVDILLISMIATIIALLISFTFRKCSNFWAMVIDTLLTFMWITLITLNIITMVLIAIKIPSLTSIEAKAYEIDFYRGLIYVIGVSIIVALKILSLINRKRSCNEILKIGEEEGVRILECENKGDKIVCDFADE